MSTTETTATQAPNVSQAPAPAMGRSATKKTAERKASTRATPMKAPRKTETKKSTQQAPRGAAPASTVAIPTTGKPVTQFKITYRRQVEGGASGSAGAPTVKTKLK